MTINIGFTGTRVGMTVKQFDEIVEFIKIIQSSEDIIARHGDCIGADADFHDICEALNIPIIIHPPILRKNRAFKTNYLEIKEEKDYGVRDKDIVVESDIMLACPKLLEEELRSGTWATIRYSQKIGRELFLFWPR